MAENQEKDLKVEEPKVEEVKTETVKDSKPEEVKAETTKVEEVKTESKETKPEEVETPSKEVTATQEVKAPAKPAENKPPQRNQRQGGPGGRPQGRRNNNRRNNRRDNEFEERVVDIARVTNVVKGGRRFSFSTLVVIGDKKGRVAYGHGKAKEVPGSIQKAIKDAKRKLVRVPLVEGTIPHITQAKFISSNILLKPAPKGRGIIASGSVRAVVELAGYTDIVTKSIGSNNKANSVKATIKALSLLRTTKEISSLRDKSVEHFK